MCNRAALLAGAWFSLAVCLSAGVLAEPLEKAKDAVDPDCTVGEAVKGTATKAIVGVRGNRCDVGETARDTLGIDDRERRDEDHDGPLKIRKQ
jgi:hypothetical protein